MRIYEYVSIDQHIIHQLRHMAMAIDEPIDIFYYLKPQMSTEEEFVEHMIVAFYDASLLWTVATRWWLGDMTDISANFLLSRIIDKTKPLWSLSP